MDHGVYAHTSSNISFYLLQQLWVVYLNLIGNIIDAAIMI